MFLYLGLIVDQLLCLHKGQANKLLNTFSLHRETPVLISAKCQTTARDNFKSNASKVK